METKNSNWEGVDSWAVSRDNRLFSLYSTLAEWRKTEAVSLVAVATYSGNLEYVPDHILSPEICRAALTAKDADLDVLSKIPFPEVQKEAIKMFLDEGNDPFVVYSFADISNSKMAQDAVQRNAYCIQLVPDKLLTKDLCGMALKSPNADENVRKFVDNRFPVLQHEIPKNDKHRQNEGVKMKF